MGISVDSAQNGVSHGQLLFKLQRAFCAKTAPHKDENRGAMRQPSVPFPPLATPEITKMNIYADNAQAGISHDQLLFKLQRAFCAKTAPHKDENRGAMRQRKGRRLQKKSRSSSDRQSTGGCWGIRIAESAKARMEKIFGGRVYENVAGEIETAPFLERD